MRLKSRRGCRPRAIAGDHLDAGALLEPGGERLGISVVDQIDGPASLQVDDDGAVGSAAAHRPVVDADHTRRLEHGRGRAANELKELVAAGRHAELGGEPRAGLSSKSEADGPEGVGQARGEARVGGREVRQPLAEDLLVAELLAAPELPNLEADSDGSALDGQIRE